MSRHVNVIAHRGASAARPENTLPAFQYAAELGANFIEFDVLLTRDRYPVVIHDGTVDRTTDGTGKVSELDLEYVRSLDAGEGAQIPLLDEVLSLAKERGIGLNVQLKADDANRQDLTRQTVEMLREMGFEDRAFIASDEKTVLLARQIDPERPICNLSGQRKADSLPHQAEIGSFIAQPYNAVVTPEYVAQAHELGIVVNPFYADDEDEMRRLIDCGVDGILTNEVERLLSLLGRA